MRTLKVYLITWLVVAALVVLALYFPWFQELIPRHVSLQIGGPDPALEPAFCLDFRDAGSLSDLLIEGDDVEVRLLQSFGTRGRGGAYAVTGATRVVFGEAELDIDADGLFFHGRRLTARNNIVTRDGRVLEGSFILTFR